jgi:hypothetical protein
MLIRVLLSSFAPRAGLVASRQTFARRRHLWTPLNPAAPRDDKRTMQPAGPVRGAPPPCGVSGRRLVPSRIARSGFASTSVAMAWRNGANDNVDSPDPPRSTHFRGDGELPGRRPAHAAAAIRSELRAGMFRGESTVRIRCPRSGHQRPIAYGRASMTGAPTKHN